MKFEYVSNAGIMLEVSGRQIGIDCLCKDSTKLYQDTPPQIREGLKPDIIIFTHEHEDHFCAEYVKEVWERNPNMQIYSTKRAIEIMQGENIPFTNLHQLADGEVLEFESLYIKFMESVHEGEQYSDVQNFTLLINKEDKKLVVTGDAMPCKELFERISKWSSRIDWFFAPFPYVGLRSTRKLISEHLDIENIFALHQPRPEADKQGWVANTKRVCEVAKDSLPQPIFPEKLGEWYCM
ncbi:MAG: MBL fold metallo-hydrolase [Tyzzerella sp.]|nr:MBL fold metallo-hydrolase [Tyzzerella sp.]